MPELARQLSRDARQQHTAVIRKLIRIVDEIPLESWVSKERQDTTFEALTRLLGKGSSIVQDVLTEDHMDILTLYMAKQRYGAAVILIDVLLEEMAAMLGN
jgi:hypothetical protein